MRKVLGLALLLLYTANSFGSTEVSKFTEKQYASEYKHNNVHIIVKKEYTLDYAQVPGKNTVNTIIYGYGDMKIKGQKKFRISYICLLNDNNQPFWSHVIQTK